MTPYTLAWHAIPELDSWGFDPSVQKNATNSFVSYGSVRWQPNQVTMHPGPNGEYSVLRFTAPACGDYDFSAAFVGQDVVGTSTDVHVVKNGVPVWSGQINGYLRTTSGQGSVHLSCRDTLDVQVGTGSNGTYFFDTTGVEFSVVATAVEEGCCPVATDDFYGVDQAHTLDQPAPGILVNDSGPENESLSVSLVDGPSHALSFTLNADGSFTYTPTIYFYGTDTFTYRANAGTEYSDVATVHITVSQPGAQGFITGGGKFFQDGRKCTFGFVAKVAGTGVMGNFEFQDHGLGLNAKSDSLGWVNAPNQTDGYFSGACSLNGQAGYTFFVQLHDRGEPGRNDDFAVWVLDALGSLVYSSGGPLSSGGNIVIHGN